MSALRLGSQAPNFKADTTKGPIDFHDFIGSSWVILFSHPADYTPVCTTELGAVAKLSAEFEKRNVKLIGLSCNGLNDHEGWITDIDRTQHCTVNFPIIADEDRKVATLYGMLDSAEHDPTNLDKKGNLFPALAGPVVSYSNSKTVYLTYLISTGIPFTVRNVFVIDPKKSIRLVISYPGMFILFQLLHIESCCLSKLFASLVCHPLSATTGRNFDEILRVVDSLQLTDTKRVTTPANWRPGDKVIVHPSVTKDEAEKLFPGYETVTPYLRLAKLG
ncbi:thioredoxin-like protein [Paraphysoderma sedebokerense]|nr:thioredoxin-like protein [Paraphysoderma sedebokerense]KAI9139064.1 thioredoxin-like protein [Paraphysoderma sedebokerense]